MKVLTGTGECLGGVESADWGAGTRLLGVPGRLQAALTPSSTPTTPISRERQRDDARLPSRCLQVPAGFPGGTPGQGDAGLTPVPQGRGTACSCAGRGHPSAPRGWGHLGTELWCVIKVAVPGRPPVSDPGLLRGAGSYRMAWQGVRLHRGGCAVVSPRRVTCSAGSRFLAADLGLSGPFIPK